MSSENKEPSYEDQKARLTRVKLGYERRLRLDPMSPEFLKGLAEANEQLDALDQAFKLNG